MLSLSESGCLLRSTEPQMLGSRFLLTFALPRTGDLAITAELGGARALSAPPGAVRTVALVSLGVELGL